MLNGRPAYRYLRGAGYDASSGFAQTRSAGQLIADRLTHTADETGWALALLVLLVSAPIVARAVRRRDQAALLTTAVALCTLTALSTSSNLGTAFALPVVVLAAALAVGALPRRRAVVAAIGLTLAASVVALPGTLGVARHPVWLAGTPGEAQALTALGCDCLTFDSQGLNRDVLHHLTSPALIVRDDDLLNVNSLESFSPALQLRTPPYGATTVGPLDLSDIRTVVSGTTTSPYHGHLQLAAVTVQLTEAGFRPIWKRHLSDANEIVVWGR
jgi:hypothetical protein